jgi:hypothetical protein
VLNDSVRRVTRALVDQAPVPLDLRCWADADPGMCILNPTTEIGLCDGHYRAIFGRQPPP